MFKRERLRVDCVDRVRIINKGKCDITFWWEAYIDINPTPFYKLVKTSYVIFLFWYKPYFFFNWVAFVLFLINTTYNIKINTSFILHLNLNYNTPSLLHFEKISSIFRGLCVVYRLVCSSFSKKICSIEQKLEQLTWTVGVFWVLGSRL